MAYYLQRQSFLINMKGAFSAFLGHFVISNIHKASSIGYAFNNVGE